MCEAPTNIKLQKKINRGNRSNVKHSMYDTGNFSDTRSTEGALVNRAPPRSRMFLTIALSQCLAHVLLKTRLTSKALVNVLHICLGSADHLHGFAFRSMEQWLVSGVDERRAIDDQINLNHRVVLAETRAELPLHVTCRYVCLALSLSF